MSKLNSNSKRPLAILNFTQFLSAFADSVIIIVIAFMLKKSLNIHDENDPHIFLVETFFLFSYIMCAPFVGTFADRNPKSKVLLVGNSIKAIGILMIMVGINPAFCYAVVGLGAAVYGPAKYGILSELTTNNKDLLDANGRLEGYTILAIIIGTVVGGILADYSTIFGQIFCFIVYVVSLALTFFIPTFGGNKSIQYKEEAKEIFKDVRLAFKNPKMKFSYIGSGSFWMISVVIKNALFLWIPVHLGIQGGFPLSLIIGMTAIGIVIGSMLARKFTSIEKFYRANLFGLIVAAIALIFPIISGHNLFSQSIVCALLLALGTFAGMFVIPLNASLQVEGNQLLGVGKTIAVQNLVDNSMMFIGTYAVYLMNHLYHFSVTASLLVFGLVYLSLMFYLTVLSNKFRKNTEILPN